MRFTEPTSVVIQEPCRIISSACTKLNLDYKEIKKKKETEREILQCYGDVQQQWQIQKQSSLRRSPVNGLKMSPSLPFSAKGWLAFLCFGIES